MTVRNFEWTDLPSLTCLINQVSTADADFRTSDSSSLQAWLCQPGLFPERDCWLVESEGQTRAYAILHHELKIGRTILEVGIPNSDQGQDIEAVLVRQAVTTAKKLGAQVLHVCTTPESHLSRILRNAGFWWIRRYWTMHWQESQIPAPKPPSGFSITTFRKGEEKLLAQVQNDSFDGSWGFCPNTIEEVTYRLNLRTTPTGGIFFLRDSGNIAGYCWTYIDDNHKPPIGTIGMMGITPAYRGRYLSKPIVLAGMNFLHARDVDHIELNVDESNHAAIRLYRSVGFEKKTELHWFEILLSAL